MVKDAIGRSRIRNRDYEHLLQVWSREGKCIFERELTAGARLINWFINKDVFVWEEKAERLTRFYLLKLFPERKPDLFEINVEVGPDNTGDEDVKDKPDWKKFDSYRFMRVCYMDGYIFFSRKDQIHFFDVDSKMQQQTANLPMSSPTMSQSVSQSDTRTINIVAGDILSFKVNLGSTMKCFLDIGSE